VTDRGEPDGVPPARTWWSPADFLTAIRVPLAVMFLLIPDAGWRIAILGLASASDLADGLVARRWGGSRLGAFLDPVADKLFLASAFGVVLWSGALSPLEIVGVLARDLAAAVAFFATMMLRRPASIPARLGGKAVTVCQFLTVFAFVVGSELLRPLAWATAAVALYAIWDYQRVAMREQRPLGE
jgi:phosphatidylglycerophosphate synthase